MALLRAMIVGSPPSRWWHGLLAIAVLFGLLTPPSDMPIAPGWLAAAICHAPVEDGTPDPHHAPVHIHCGLCQVGHTVGTLPGPAIVPLPSMAAIAPIRVVVVLWPGPGPNRFYASRAPPRFG